MNVSVRHTAATAVTTPRAFCTCAPALAPFEGVEREPLLDPVEPEGEPPLDPEPLEPPEPPEPLEPLEPVEPPEPELPEPPEPPEPELPEPLPPFWLGLK